MSLQAISRLEAQHDYASPKNVSASALIETGPGTLQGIVINSHSSGTLKFWDNTAGSGTVLFNTITLAVGERWIPFFGAHFNTGCYLTIGGTADVTVLYN